MALITPLSRPLAVSQPRVEDQPPMQTAELRPGDTFHAARTAAAQPSSTEREIATKIGNLVQRQFGGDWHKAFDHYAGGAGREVTRDGVLRMLQDAGVNWPPPGMVAGRLMDRFDADRSGSISWREFSTSMRNLGFQL